MSFSIKLATNKLALSITDRFLKIGNEIILGKTKTLKLSLCCLLGRGHLLLEDIPGVGKTTLVKFLSKAIGLDFRRIQFTSDLLPSDILGVSVFDQGDQRFRFHRGPIFGQLVLGDELNRATPKTQSAFLQAMEEQKITIDGHTYALPEPFFLVATQNPRQQIGTFPLPEAQLDRFMMRLSIGYPDRQAEGQLLSGINRQVLLDKLQPVISIQEFTQIQNQVALVHVSDAIITYIQDILEASRIQYQDVLGLSPRAGLDLISAAKSWAFMHGREMVIPEDVQAVAVGVTSHRLQPIGDTHFFGSQERAQELINSVRVV